MTRLEDIKGGAFVRGLAPQHAVQIVSVDWIGQQALNVVYRDQSGAIAESTLYRDDERRIALEAHGRLWSFDADAGLLRLVTEANRIKLAHHFDLYLAIRTCLVERLPHQISAVYGEMLPRQPLRFLLADDPGAGKTIMAGLLMKDLIARSDLERCLVVAPGSLVEQWQDELGEKFNLEFDILTRDMIETSRSGNPFNDRSRLIVRLDVLARNEELQDKLLKSQEWDLIICDEAHRMSATYFGGEVKYTKRYQVGQRLGQICRHLLLMSATPHNGKEEDFQLFMALLDGDRFEGRFRDGVHYADTSDMMRRLTKEELLRFDGRPLFPERRAYTVKYQLSPKEAALYSAVTDYVRTEMNRVQRFAEGDNKKRNNVGFALQILQRRLASSPAAIYQSLKRRRERLENELQYGEQEEVRARLFRQVDGAVDQQHLLELLKRRALTNDTMPEARVQELRLEMERAEALRLQPHHIQSFFVEAFQHLGGRLKKREEGRWEITLVPARIRERDRPVGTGAPIQKKYERICFDKSCINQQPVAAFVCPGHPLLESVISIIREDYDQLMTQGAVLVDDTDIGTDLTAIFLLDHSVQDGQHTAADKPHVISQKLQFAAIDKQGKASSAGIAPHLNLRPAKAEELALVRSELEQDWLTTDLEKTAVQFATVDLAQNHVAEVKARRLPEIEKVEQEVRARLKKEVNYWDSRAFELKEEEKAGKKTRLNWQNAGRRAEDLAERLKRRLAQLEQERFITSQPPHVRGGMVVIPQGLLAAKRAAVESGVAAPTGFAQDPLARREIELLAMEAVMAAEKALGNMPTDVSAQKIGYDIASLDSKSQHLRFIEVKGRIDGADSVMVTRQEVITSLHEPEKFILAVVQVENGFAREPRYVRKPFSQEPEFGVTAIQVNLQSPNGDRGIRSETP